MSYLFLKHCLTLPLREMTGNKIETIEGFQENLEIQEKRREGVYNL